MECVPDLSYLTMSQNNNVYELAMEGGSVNRLSSSGGDMNNNNNIRPCSVNKRRKSFNAREIEVLLSAVDKRKDAILSIVPNRQKCAKAWREVTEEVNAVEGAHRTEADLRRKWSNLKWKAKNWGDPGRDPTVKTILQIVSSMATESGATGASTLFEESPVPELQIGSEPDSVSPVPQETPNEVCLRWNSYRSDMQSVFPTFLSYEQFVDVTLACEGRSIKCHKVILSACSTYFEELLTQNPCRHPIVLIKDLPFEQIAALVDFMYHGEVRVSEKELPSLLNAAEALQIKGLVGQASSHSRSRNDSPTFTDSGNNLPYRRCYTKSSETPHHQEPLLTSTNNSYMHSTSSTEVLEYQYNVLTQQCQINNEHQYNVSPTSKKRRLGLLNLIEKIPMTTKTQTKNKEEMTNRVSFIQHTARVTLKSEELARVFGVTEDDFHAIVGGDKE